MPERVLPGATTASGPAVVVHPAGLREQQQWQAAIRAPQERPRCHLWIGAARVFTVEMSIRRRHGDCPLRSASREWFHPV